MQRAILLVLCVCCFSCLPAFGSTPLTNTEVTAAQLAHLFRNKVPTYYYCQQGIYDDLGNLDGDWAPPSHGRVTSAAWDLGDGRYLYAYQLSNPNNLEGDTGFFGNWDVAISGHSGYLSIPLRQLHITPIDYDGDEQLDTSFHLSDHACNSEFSEGNDCAPLTGAFSVFTAGTDPCAKSWSDYYAWDEDGPDAIVEALEGRAGDANHANFAVRYSPGVCCHGIFQSTPIFGFVTDAPPLFAEGHYLDGTSSSIRLVAPAPRALLVHGFCDTEEIWNTFESALTDSGFEVERLEYGSADYSRLPDAYVGDLRAKLINMASGDINVVAHSMGGLIARKYMQEQARSTDPNRISRLITLGTPHHGSDIARWALPRYNALKTGGLLVAPLPTAEILLLLRNYTMCLLDPRSAVAAATMLPGSKFLNELNYGANRTLDDPPGSHGWDFHESETNLPQDADFISISGTSSFCKYPELKDRIWGRGANYNHNDAVVAVGSALFTNPSVEQALDTQLLGSPVTHFESGFTCGATYYTSSALAQKTASMLLRGMDGGESMQRAMAAPVRVEDSETSQDDSLRAMPAIVDTVPSGQVAEQSFVIPHTTAAHIMLVSTDATLTLETPTGGMITPADTATVDGLTYYGEPGSGFAGFHIDHPAAGTWVAHVDGTAAASTQTYAVMVEYASPYVAEMSTPSLSLHPGDTLRVRAAISLEGTPVPSVAWTCYLVRPDDSVISLPVFDDGAHDDGSADDGTYGAVVVTGAGFGDYQAFGRVTLGTGEAFATGTAATVAQFADLSVDSLDIYLSKNLVVADDSVSVFVTVHNHGPSAAMGVLVTVTDERTFDELGTATLDIAANGSATAQLPWRLAEPDTHRLHVSVSPYGPPSEASLANNAANRTVILGYPVGVGEEAPLKGQLSFRAPRPNPSHGTVTLTFGLPTSAEATLEVFDVLGRRVRRWEWPLLAAGTHSVDWNGTTDSGHTLPVGVFLCRLRVGTETRSQKVILR